MNSGAFSGSRAAKAFILVLMVHLSGASCEDPDGWPTVPPFDGDPAQPSCGFPMEFDLPEPPSDPCGVGTVVFGPETFVRDTGAPHEALRTFTVPAQGAICLVAVNSGTASARLVLDGVELLAPNQLTPHVGHLSTTANVTQGVHNLSVRLSSQPGSALTIEVRFVPAGIADHGRIVGDQGKTAVSNLFDAPDPFSPANGNGIKDTAILSATAEVLHLGGGPGFDYLLRYAFQIADADTCGHLRTLPGVVLLDPGDHLAYFPLSATWDGRSDAHDMLPEGVYYYRVVVQLLRRNAGGEWQELDSVASNVQTITIDNDPSVDEPDPVTLGRVPEDIIQSIPDPFGQSEIYPGVDEPAPEPQTGSSGVSDGTGTIRCYDKSECDPDGDGYAWIGCPNFDNIPQEDIGGKSICTDEWVQFVEPKECGYLGYPGAGSDIWQKRIRPYLANNWFTEFVMSAYWLSNLGNLHPRQIEVEGNYVDDNCNGLIDETQFLYLPWGLNPGPGEFKIQVRVNDKKIRQTANVIVAHVIDLADIECPGGWENVDRHPGIAALRRGMFTYSIDTNFYDIAPPVTRNWFWYSGERSFWLDITGLPNESRVYAMALTYYKLGIDPGTGETDFWQLRCLDNDGLVTSNTACTDANRIASDVFFTAVEEKLPAAPASFDRIRLRRLVTNRTLFEWHLSEQVGSVGGLKAANALDPDGTRYGANYREAWCTEFAAYVYGRSSTNQQISDPETVAQMVDYFAGLGLLDIGQQAVDNMSADPTQWGILGPAQSGDFLGITYEEDANKKSHSSIFITNSGELANWNVGGNESRKVQMTCEDNYSMSYEHYTFHYLGHLSNELPSQ